VENYLQPVNFMSTVTFPGFEIIEHITCSVDIINDLEIEHSYANEICPFSNANGNHLLEVLHPQPGL